MKRVLVIGDTILDIYTYGKVERVSPEAPIPVFDYEKEETILGGACNVASNISSLSSLHNESDIDYFGYTCPEVNNLLYERQVYPISKKMELYYSGILRKKRIVADRHQIVRIDYNKKYYNDSFLLFRSLPLEKYDLLVVSDYNKGTLEYEHFEFLSKINVPKIIDLKCLRSGPPIVFRDNTVIKCNEKEYGENPSLKNICTNIVVTKGSKGYTVLKNNKSFCSLVQEGNVVDVVGAGDVFLAGMAVNYLETGKFNVEEMCEFGNRCAGEKIKNFGTISVSRGEVDFHGKR